MRVDSTDRYTGIAIGIHWLIAILIIGMLGVGKYMTGLAEEDATRFLLTQWHKSIGITLLLLSVLRILWRYSHKPPALPASTPGWEKNAAHFTHLALYVLLIAVPLTGWIMVSASSLSLKTVLFGAIPWPDFPLVAGLAERFDAAGLFHELHELSSGLLMALLILHVGAALRHHFQKHDGIMSRMSPLNTDRKLMGGLGFFSLATATLTAALVGYASTVNKAAPLAASGSHVSFAAVVMGSDLEGLFADTEVTLTLDLNNPAEGSLQALVRTASLTTGDVQIDSTLPETDWFDVMNFPEATFNSTSFAASDNDAILVEGNLVIKGITKSVSFPLTIARYEEGQEDGQGAGQTATGGFSINRLDYGIGLAAQPADDTVGFNVLIEFTIELQ